MSRLAYDAVQQSRSYFSIFHKLLNDGLRKRFTSDQPLDVQKLDADHIEAIKKRLSALLDQDWKDAETGVYPRKLLFDIGWKDFVRYYPSIWLDAPSKWTRINKRQYQAFSPEIDTTAYPNYYLQNFHHQTDGYLSDTSANLYDLQVELGFHGTTDAMRRRIIAPLKSALDGSQPVTLLDVACGTGRTLKMLQESLSDVSLFGIDLSAPYLRKAKALLSQSSHLPKLVQGNAEAIPFLNNFFDAVVSVFLFHELPPDVRQNVINECYRVMKPGGMLVLCDSIQASDAPEIKVTIENFPKYNHEPYYCHYITDDMNLRLTNAGFVEIENEVHFISKYWIARKPE